MSKNCTPFENCRTEIDGTFVDEVNFINIAMPMYNLHTVIIILTTSGSLWQLKRDEINNNAHVTNNDNAT